MQKRTRFRIVIQVLEIECKHSGKYIRSVDRGRSFLSVYQEIRNEHAIERDRNIRNRAGRWRHIRRQQFPIRLALRNAAKMRLRLIRLQFRKYDRFSKEHFPPMNARYLHGCNAKILERRTLFSGPVGNALDVGPDSIDYSAMIRKTCEAHLVFPVRARTDEADQFFSRDIAENTVEEKDHEYPQRNHEDHYGPGKGIPPWLCLGGSDGAFHD